VVIALKLLGTTAMTGDASRQTEPSAAVIH
jgi:hypothetical protein